mgnify:CR=1 FL=1|tara:strand:- start:181 stop:369 length:189 start_codon:yes stop_codon:yes gene_type:complete
MIVEPRSLHELTIEDWEKASAAVWESEEIDRDILMKIQRIMDAYNEGMLTAKEARWYMKWVE